MKQEVTTRFGNVHDVVVRLLTAADIVAEKAAEQLANPKSEPFTEQCPPIDTELLV